MPSRWSDDVARSLLSAWRGSGLSVEQFAQQQGLKPQRIYRWRKKLDGSSKDSLALLPVHMTSSKRSGEPVAVLLRTGQVIKVSRGFDEEAFARAVTILEGSL